MSNIVLPTERRKAQNYNPKLLVIMGKPKSGKSTIMASLNNNLIIDLEDGYRALDVMCVQARSAKDIFEIKTLIAQKNHENGDRPFYRFITIDNATRLEEMSLAYAAHLYRQTQMGASWGMLKDKMGIPLKTNGKLVPDPKADVRQLPNGAGYLYLRNALKEMIHMFIPLCDTLILVCHVKDSQIKKNGQEMSEMSVDLAGKLASIICGEADAVGYVYREGNKTFMSFEGGNDTIREARPLHLRGKKFVVAESDDENNLKINTSFLFVRTSDKMELNLVANGGNLHFPQGIEPMR